MCWTLGGSTVYSRHWTSTHRPSLRSSLQVGRGLGLPPSTYHLLYFCGLLVGGKCWGVPGSREARSEDRWNTHFQSGDSEPDSVG